MLRVEVVAVLAVVVAVTPAAAAAEVREFPPATAATTQIQYHH